MAYSINSTLEKIKTLIKINELASRKFFQDIHHFVLYLNSLCQMLNHLNIYWDAVLIENKYSNENKLHLAKYLKSKIEEGVKRIISIVNT